MKENVLVSLCFTGVPCRFHGRSVASPKKIEKLSARYNLIPVCPEQLGGLQSPRPAAPLKNKDGKYIENIKGIDVSRYFLKGAERTLHLANVFNCKKAYFCKGSPSCDKKGFTGELLISKGVEVFNL